uniref:NADH-ubiquinone oxidoreductase chain 2 n=1 Tax=Psoroptes ovis TaxID=83912 RepID=A0A075XDS2_PSOOV|nr:NADH dehydrogenase subunit 2 [Psoroptes ovis]AIH15209.1 NADH dehydrogenase subunit 2 [Psoroptes ovis]
MFIILSSLLAISSSSWVMMWVFMEMNSLALCGMMSKELKKNSMTSSPSMFYLLVQLPASIIFLIFMTSNPNSKTIMCMGILVMMIKSGAFPFHMWYLKTLGLLNMSSPSMKMIMTWQKIIPFFILSYFKLWELLVILGLMNMLIPLVKMSKLSSMKSILVLSSINNNSWFMMSSLLSFMILSLYFMIYSLSLLITMSFLKSVKKKSFILKENPMETMLVIMNLGGIPPSVMFLGKMIIFTLLVKMNLPKEIMMLMLMMACYFMYHYLWCTFPYLMNTPLKSQNQVMNKNTTFMLTLMMLL